MDPRLARLLAMVATCLLVVSGIHAWLAPPPAPPSRLAAGKPKAQADLPCKIKHAIFGGTQAELLKFPKGRSSHYVVVDNPNDNPMIPFYQRDWIETHYGDIRPAVIGQFATVEEALATAAMLCKRN